MSTGEFKEIIKNRINGILVQPKNYKDLGESLIELIQNQKLVQKIAKNGYNY